MVLKQLIYILSQEDPNREVRYGFGEPMSYRGYYDQLAFDPVENTTVGDMLRHAESAMGVTFTGYKGGEYLMDEWTDCWIANYGDSGDQLSTRLLNFMLGCEDHRWTSTHGWDGTGEFFT